MSAPDATEDERSGFAVHSLSRKWRRVAKELRPAIEAYEELTRAAGPELVAKWTEDAQLADEARDTDPAAMDIYDINGKPRECPFG